MEIPEQIDIHLVDRNGDQIEINNVAIYLHVSAQRKNDYFLGPYFSNSNGVIVITSDDIKCEVQATQEPGIMDYSSIEDANTKIEINVYTNEELIKIIDSRKNVWKELMKGEENRWKSINQ